jgi:hypothetical protein
MIWLAQLVEAEALNVMEASLYWPHNVHEPILAFYKCCTHPTKCMNLQILQKLVAKPRHGVLQYLPMNKNTNGQLPGL